MESQDNMEVALVIVGLGGVAVAVESDCALVRELLAEFYPVEPDPSEPMWTIVAYAQAPPRGVDMNRFGVGYQPDIARRSLTLWAKRETDLAITTRKCVREIFLDACERAGYGMLHASAVYRDDQAIVFAADKRGGKTTLALRAVLDHGWRWLSNDHLIVWRGEAGLVATSLPPPTPGRGSGKAWWRRYRRGSLRRSWLGMCAPTGQRLHQRHLPFPHRDVAAFGRDCVALASQVAATAAEVVRFTHRGDPSPLLASNAEAVAR